MKDKDYVRTDAKQSQIESKLHWKIQWKGGAEYKQTCITATKYISELIFLLDIWENGGSFKCEKEGRENFWVMKKAEFVSFYFF